jgi:hypothetical protein
MPHFFQSLMNWAERVQVLIPELGKLGQRWHYGKTPADSSGIKINPYDLVDAENFNLSAADESTLL